MDSTKNSTQEQTSTKSPGQQAETKTKTCEVHGDFEAEVIALGFNNKPIYTICPECEKERESEEHKEKEYEDSYKANKRLSACGVPKRFEKSTVNGYNPTCENAKKVRGIIAGYVSNFSNLIETGASLVLCGRPGTGKTHLACAVAIELTKEYSTKYTTVFNLMTRVKETYHKDAQESIKEVIRDHIYQDLLVIDEVGIQYGSEHEKIIFYQIINGRYESVKPTILISNLTESELTEFVGERCIDRMREGGGAVIAFDWDSYRGKSQ
jgi:DNA replication protein DnaC